VNSRFRLLLIGRALWLRRRRLSVALLALLVGASLSSALLSTYADLEQKMAREFRRYGANLVIAPQGETQTLPEETLAATQIPEVGAAPFLYVVGRVNDADAVLAGTDFTRLRDFARTWHLRGEWPGAGECLAGERLGVEPGAQVNLTVGAQTAACRVAAVIATGASEDSQILLPLAGAQRLAALPGRLSLIQLNAAPADVERVRGQLAAALPAAEVRTLRPVAESTARVLLKVRGLLLASTVIILAIIALAVATTLSAIVWERRKDIGVMKALGAGERQIAALLLSESALLGLAAGLAGYAAGLALAQWIGQSIYQSAVAVRPQVFPQVVLVTVAVAVAATVFPLRMVRDVQPAAVLKGE
jgi:putative ABC transport system permease protein